MKPQVRGGGGSDPREVLEGGEGGEGGVWDPKVCVPKMARPDFPSRKFRFFPRWSLWSGGGGTGVQGGGGLPPPPSTLYGPSHTSLPPPHPPRKCWVVKQNSVQGICLPLHCSSSRGLSTSGGLFELKSPLVYLPMPHLAGPACCSGTQLKTSRSGSASHQSAVEVVLVGDRNVPGAACTRPSHQLRWAAPGRGIRS